MLECPKCRTNEFTNPSLVMLINECGHPLCKNCVENIFIRNQAQCPHEGCGKVLKKSGFWEQLFDNPDIEREVFIRKRLNKIYNMQEDDFPDLRAYNDYLEHVEEIVQRLLWDEDTTEVELEIRKFREENADIIERNRKRPTADEIWVQQMIDEETQRTKRMMDEQNNEEHMEEVKFNPKSIIKELRDSDIAAEILLDQKRKQQIEAELAEKKRAEERKREKHEKQRRFAGEDRKALGELQISGRPYIHILPPMESNGPSLPSIEEIEAHYTPHLLIGEEANIGGLTAALACSRQLIDARSELFAH